MSKYLLLYIHVLGLFACQDKSLSSSEKMTPEARLVMGAAQDFSATLLADLDDSRLQNEGQYQRTAAWALWADLSQAATGVEYPLQRWQTWYGKEDLQNIFRRLFGSLGKQGRADRRDVTAAEIEAAMEWNDSLRFQDPEWDQKRFDLWLAKYDSEKKQRSMPGMNRIVMNGTALKALLAQYARLYRCQVNALEDKACAGLQMPEGSALLKTAWRRGETKFSIPYYQVDQPGLLEQFSKNQWQAAGAWIPAEGESFAMQTATGQIFHLAGVRLSLKRERRWFWQSLWLDPEKSYGLAKDQPSTLNPLWSHYQLCAVGDFHVAKWEAEGETAAVEAVPQASWCSSPFLETGEQNHKTNCIGCHQHAGSAWNEAEFRRRLSADLASLSLPAEKFGPSDFVWSIFNGPEPFVSFIAQTIDDYDIYDLFETQK